MRKENATQLRERVRAATPERGPVKFHHFLGVLVGAGLGYLVDRSPEAIAAGGGAGAAAAVGLERLVKAIGRKIVYEFVNK